jgi:hypothetical protein
MIKQTVNFKLRVLDLFEIIMKKRESDTLVLSAMMPLLQALKIHSSSDKDVDVFNKCMGVFRLFKSISYPKEIEQKEVESIAEQVCELTLKCRDKQSLEWYALAYAYLFKIIRGNFENSNIIVLHYENLLKNFLLEKNTNLSVAFFNGLFSRYPEDGWNIFGFLVSATKSASSGFAQFQGFSLMETILRHNSKSYEAQITKQFVHAKELIESFISFFDISEGAELKSNRSRTILKVAYLLLQTSKIYSLGLNSSAEINNFVSKLQLVLQTEKYKNLKGPISNILNFLQVSEPKVVEGGKRKREDGVKLNKKQNKKVKQSQ